MRVHALRLFLPMLASQASKKRFNPRSGLIAGHAKHNCSAGDRHEPISKTSKCAAL